MSEIINKNIKLKKLFNSGDYKKSALMAEAELDESNYSVISVLIGSYVFIGETKKANGLFKKFKKHFALEDHALSIFYLAIGFTRSGDIQQAKSLILECFSLYRKTPKNSFIRFSFFQSLGFLSYFRSRFRKSLRYAKAAKESAYETHEESLIILADDLVANNQIISGEIYSGIEGLRECYVRSLKVRNMNLAKSIRVSIISFESQYGLLSNPILTLKGHLKKIHPQNTYSRNLIWLALMNQFLNQGRLRDFEIHYPLAQKEIFKIQQPRHQILLRFKWAHWEFLRFNYEAALLELAKIEEALSTKNDILLLSQIYGLRYKILKDRNPERAAQIFELLKFWHKVSGSNQSLSHLSRIRSDHTASQSQDQIGNMINEYYQLGSSGSVKQLISRKRWIHFHDQLDHTLIRAHGYKKVLVLGFEGNKGLFLTDGNWSFVPEPTILEKKLLNQLSTEPLSKEQLVNLIWGYSYSPLAHDPMLMTLIQRARKYLDNLGLKINVSEGVYQLSQPLLLSELTEKLALKVTQTGVQRAAATDMSLSFRQFQILETISMSTAPISIGALLKIVKVSRMTLFRDLRELHLQKKVTSLGKGRGVGYVLYR